MLRNEFFIQMAAGPIREIPSPEGNRNGAGLLVEDLLAGNCNDILSRQFAFLRDEGELTIITPDGSKKPRAKTINWDDRLVLPSERSLFSRLGW